MCRFSAWRALKRRMIMSRCVVLHSSSDGAADRGLPEGVHGILVLGPTNKYVVEYVRLYGNLVGDGVG